jgi:5-methylcytosine-specific restriction enzyme A
MQKTDAERIAKRIESSYGVSISESFGISEGYPFIKLHLDLLPPLKSCSIYTHIFWKSIEISLIPDDYARNLVESMGKSPEGNRAFSTVASDIIKNQGRIDFSINGHRADSINPETWDSEWISVNLKLTVFTEDVDLADINNLEPILIKWIGKYFMLILSLLPIETEQISQNNRGMPEGALIRVLVNKYERNPVNREICISMNGCYCQVCGFNFEEEYGMWGSGFIHVHHITPVSKLGKDYIINPLEDLVPICPNCHAIIHKTDPPLTVNQLKNIIKKIYHI